MLQKCALLGSKGVRALGEVPRQTGAGGKMQWPLVACVIRPFKGPFGLETADLGVTQGFLPPGNKPSAGCNDVVPPSHSQEGPSSAPMCLQGQQCGCP